MRSRTTRSILAVAFLGLLSSLLLATPAAQAASPTPGPFSGYAFDACHTPPQDVMDTWLEQSPYWGIGVYVSGDNRACDNEPNLNPTWVATQLSKGWKILPLTVGRQAQCYSTNNTTKISEDPTSDFLTAYSQGIAEADATAAASAALGIPGGSTQWLDIEHFPYADATCRASVLAFTRGWTSRLHDYGYLSGFYSSASSGIRTMAEAKAAGVSNLPDHLWIAEWNGVVTTLSKYISDSLWTRQRIKQYHGGTYKTYGGKTWNIDGNWIEIGGGTKAGKAKAYCGKFSVDSAPIKRVLHKGHTGTDVRILQCMLKAEGYFRGSTTSKFDKKTIDAVKKFQRTNHIRVTGSLTKGTRVALMAEPKRTRNFLKIGSGGNNVRRLQRTMRAAVDSKLKVTGVYDRATASAVKKYQAKLKRTQTGVVTPDLWERMMAGRV